MPHAGAPRQRLDRVHKIRGATRPRAPDRKVNKRARQGTRLDLRDVLLDNAAKIKLQEVRVRAAGAGFPSARC